MPPSAIFAFSMLQSTWDATPMSPSLNSSPFCGTLKGDEFRLGDIGVASQVDCYMEKAKIADGGIALCGEVYRTTLEYVRIAQNLRYLDPEGYEVFRREAIAARSAYDLNEATRDRLPSES